MSEDRSQISPSRRDRAVRRVRNLTWAVAAGTAGLATSLSVVAANAFKGHARNTASGAAAAAAPKHKHKHKRAPERRVVVPGPQHVPSISGAAPLQPPADPPSAAPTPSPTPAPAPATPTPAPATPAPAPAPAPQPQTSGGS
jgi:hypothetical protein